MADMRSTRRPPLLAPILPCAFAVFVARPPVADGEPGGFTVGRGRGRGRGRRVRAGQWTGQSGSTGNSTGPHPHFEARAGRAPGSAVDPVSWPAARGVTLR